MEANYPHYALSDRKQNTMHLRIFPFLLQMGVVHTPSGTFFISPLPSYLHDHPENPKKHTHLVYRRSTSCSDTCGVGERNDPDGEHSDK